MVFNYALQSRSSTESIEVIYDKIISHLTDNSIWRKRLANQSRKIAIRGFGRWHDIKGKEEYCDAVELEKLLGDNLDYYPNIDTKNFDTSAKTILKNVEDLKTFFPAWIKRNEDIISILNISVRESAVIDIEIYEKLCCILKLFQNEKTKVKMLVKRLELANWGGHDLGIVSKIIHEYFECEHKKGEEINYNIG